MWNKLRARHYSIMILAAIVSFETSAIAIDRFLAKSDQMAFEVTGQFRNNAFIDQLKMAEAKAQPIPANLEQFSPFQKMGGQVKPDITPIFAKAQKPGAVQSESLREKQAAVEKPFVKIDPEKWLNYSVNKGDSVGEIAALFGVPADSIRGANDLRDNSALKAGQKIRIPSGSAKLTYAVKSGDSLSKIASRFGLSLQDVIKANELKSCFLTAGQRVEIPLRVQGKNLEIAKVESTDKPEKKPAVLEKVSTPNFAANLKIEKGPALQIAALPAKSPETSIAKTEPVPASALKVAKPAEMPKAVVEQKEKPKVPAVFAMAPKDKTPAPKIETPTPKIEIPAPKVEAAASKVDAERAQDSEIKIVSHTVKTGENLQVIARQYKTTISQIVEKNVFAGRELKAGQQVKVPVNKKFYRVLQVTSHRVEVGTKLGMPVRGSLTDSYGWRNHPVYHRRLFHAGVDFAAPRGTPISSAMGGTVVYAGWLSGYGKLVVVRHPNGLSTRYGHCSSIRVKTGQMVRKGQVLGGVGSTGTATGNHLHFEVRRDGRTLNPFTMIGR